MLGCDALGLGHSLWPVTAMVKALPKGIAIGCFDTTFGDALPALRRVLASGKFPACRVHLWWSDNHIICPLEVIKDRAPKYQKLAKEFPEVKIYLSHSCEHNERSEANVRKRIALIKKLAPSCIPVNAIWRGATVPGTQEKHYQGTRLHLKGPTIISNDGHQGAHVTMYKQHPEALMCFFWLPIFNLRKEGDAPNGVKPPPKTRKNPPKECDFKVIAEIIAMIREGIA